MKKWVNRAVALLDSSLEGTRHELNEIDWKLGISPNKKRLSEHLSALANYPGGGFLVYGVSNDGNVATLKESEIELIINQLANLGRESVEPPIAIDHSVEAYKDGRVLFVFIAESNVKPVHLRGKGLDEAYIRSGGTTRKASRPEVGNLMLHSRTPCWEELRATNLMDDETMLEKLAIEPVLELLNRPIPTSSEEKLNWLESEKFVVREPAGGGYITNLGAISASHKVEEFSEIASDLPPITLPVYSVKSPFKNQFVCLSFCA